RVQGMERQLLSRKDLGQRDAHVLRETVFHGGNQLLVLPDARGIRAIEVGGRSAGRISLCAESKSAHHTHSALAELRKYTEAVPESSQRFDRRKSPGAIFGAASPQFQIRRASIGGVFVIAPASVFVCVRGASRFLVHGRNV